MKDLFVGHIQICAGLHGSVAHEDDVVLRVVRPTAQDAGDAVEVEVPGILDETPKIWIRFRIEDLVRAAEHAK